MATVKFYSKSHPSHPMLFAICSVASFCAVVLSKTDTGFGVEPEMVKIPPGRFMMGSEVSPEQLVSDFPKYGRAADYFKDEHPSHLVEISRPFQMSKTEITVGQFQQFVD